jgi:hypothetical protein
MCLVTAIVGQCPHFTISKQDVKTLQWALLETSVKLYTCKFSTWGYLKPAIRISMHTQLVF